MIIEYNMITIMMMIVKAVIKKNIPVKCYAKGVILQFPLTLVTVGGK